MLQAVIESFAIAVVLCEESGQVIFVNGTAELFARAGIGISFAPLNLASRRVIAAEPREQRALGNLIRTVARAGIEGGIQLTSSTQGRPALALVTPIETHEQNKPVRSVLVTIATDLLAPMSTEKRLMAFFKLSPTQAALATTLFNGESLADFAKTRDNKLSTVKSQLSRIFAKTGVRNQVDLMRLISVLPPIGPSMSTERCRDSAE